MGQGLRSNRESVELFWYMGHASVDRAAGWTHDRKGAKEVGLLVTDILFFRREPKWAVLLGCRTEQCSEQPAARNAWA